MWHKTRWFVLPLTVLALVVLQVNQVLAQEGTPSTGIVEVQSTYSLPWYVGVLLFIGIAIGVTVIWKKISAATKQEFMPPSCCAPLPNEDRK